MWLPIAAGLIGIAIYKNRKEGDPNSYPSWSGKVFSESNVLFKFRFNYLKIDDDGEVRNRGQDQHGYYKTRGYIKADGTVELKQTYYSGKRTIRWSGRIVGHNKIAGVWSMEKGGSSSAQFEMNLNHHHPYLMRRYRNSDTFYDRICVALSPNKKKFRGVGIDHIGHYLVCGKLRDNSKILGTINYFNKFVIHFEGVKNIVTGDYEGKWKIKEGGSGKFNLAREVNTSQTRPIQTHFCPQANSSPAGPQTIPFGFFQPVTPQSGIPVYLGTPPAQPLQVYQPVQFAAQSQPLIAFPAVGSPFYQQRQACHNANYPTPFDE
jgi:hypothetical protein